MSQRALVDRCPGLRRPFHAADGVLVRLRVPGGRVPSATLVGLLDLAASYGAPVVQLTSRGNLQLRALPDPLPEPLVTRLEASGLLPSATHELVRNVVASPRDPRVTAVVAELDAALVADPRLAQLPGRFLLAVGAAGDAVLGEPWDLAVELGADPDPARVLAPGHAVAVPRDRVVPELLARAHRFLDARDEGVWHVRDLPDPTPVVAGMTPYRPSPAAPPAPGPLGDDLVVGVPLGLLEPAHGRALAAVAEHVTLTPWRSVVVEGGARAAADLAAAGLVVDAGSAWGRLSACVGAPSCARTTSPTLDLAAAALPHLTPDGPRVHVVGCERRCGHPAGEHVTVLAPTRVEDVLAAAGGTR